MNARELRETLTFLGQTPQRVAALVAGYSESELRRRPAPDSFSALEQACHLRDIERDGYLRRVSRMLAEADPQFEDLDGAKLAIERDYHSQSLVDALAAFGDARRESVRILQNAGDAGLARTGHFRGSAPITLADLADMMRSHDSEHLKELAELRARSAPGER